MNFNFDNFEETYKKTVKDILKFFPNHKVDLLAKHNYGWHSQTHNLQLYLDCSLIRYKQALKMYSNINNDFSQFSLLDVGGFLAAFPLTLARMGYDVSLSEKYSYYQTAFDDFKEFLIKENVKVFDIDFTEKITSQELRTTYSLITNLAMLEHLPHSPVQLINNIKSKMSKDTITILEVPNMAYWPNRFKLLKGETILPSIEIVLKSDVPFVGHHREYTISEFEKLIILSDLKLIQLETFNYTPWPKGNWKQKLLLEYPINNYKSCKEIIIASCKL